MIAIMSAVKFFTQLERACKTDQPVRIELDRGQTLFRQNDAPPGLPLLMKGQVDLVRWTEAGQSIRIHVAREGETFAEASLFAETCHCDAVAVVPSVVYVLRRKAVLRAFEHSHCLAQAFTQHIAQSLMNARRMLELRAITPLTSRTLARLGELADATGHLPTGTKLQSIAADLDVTPPALYRALATLEAEGALLRPARGRVQLLVPKGREPN